MPLPITRGELDRLGQRLAAAEPVGDDDLDLLRAVLDVYDSEALPAVERKLHDLGFSPTTRVKTTGTLIDKLRRENGMRLSRMQDVAGARIVIDGSRREQDEAVARIVAAFGQHAKPPKDRRAQPSSGYRAVHVVVLEGGLPVEIQVRTDLQDGWAQLFEGMGDKWGRQIRYGQEPDEPDTGVGLAVAGTAMTRRELVQTMMELSDQIDDIERSHLTFLQLTDEQLPAAAESAEYEALKAAVEAAHVRTVAQGREAADRFRRIAEQLRRGQG